jgi:hypothetical protein
MVSVTTKLIERVMTLASTSVLEKTTVRMTASYCSTVAAPLSVRVPFAKLAAMGDPAGSCAASTSPLWSGEMVTLAELRLAWSASLTVARLANAIGAVPW